MKHKYIEKLIQKQIDREIDPKQERALNEHIAECGDCREFYQEMINTCISLETMPEFYPAPGFNDRIMNEFGWRMRSIFKRFVAGASVLWISTLTIIILSFHPANFLNSFIKKVPALVRFAHGFNVVMNMLNHFFEPLLKNTFNPSWIAFGIILCLLTTILLGRIVKKEVTCTAS